VCEEWGIGRTDGQEETKGRRRMGGRQGRWKEPKVRVMDRIGRQKKIEVGEGRKEQEGCRSGVKDGDQRWRMLKEAVLTSLPTSGW
jgi:hypothetical protein